MLPIASSTISAWYKNFVQLFTDEKLRTAFGNTMLTERKMPQEYINARGNGVTQQFVDWCRPLIGDELPELVSFC